MSTTTDKLGLTKMELTDTNGAWMNSFNGNMETLDGILGLVYPVGSIYMSVNSTSPATLFGGTWEALGGKFLIGANSSHAAGATGGSETKTISTANLPSHTHGLNSHKHSIGAHSHGLNSHVHSVGAHSHGLNSHTHSYSAPANHTHTATNIVIVGPGSAYAVNGVTKPASGGVSLSTSSNSASAAAATGAASGSTANSSAFNTGAASGSTANSTAFDSGAASGNTAATGSGTAMDIMPPFLSVYMWKRTA